MLTAQVLLPGLSSSVPTARHFVESILTSWGYSDLGWTAALVVSELAANCALHARTDFSVRVVQTADAVRIEVTDGSPRVPQQRSYGPEATTGRGLRLVSGLAEQWGVTSLAEGKTVWVELPLTGSAERGGDDANVDEDALLAAFGDDDAPGSPVVAVGGTPVAA